MIRKKIKYQTVDYIFWILFILSSNPGGILHAIGLGSSEGSVTIRDLIFFSLVGCFAVVKYRNNNHTHKITIRYLIIFGIYYFIVFGYITPIFKGALDYSYFTFLKKSRTTVYNFVLFIIVYTFYLRSYVLFYKILIISTILTISLFLLSFSAGVDIIPYDEVNRGFVDVKRIFLKSYGNFFLLVPMGFTILVFLKNKFKWKKYIMFAFFLTAIVILLTITRRHLIGFFIYFIIATLLYNYFEHKPLLPIKKIVSVLVYVVILGFLLSLSFPKYIEAAKIGFEQSLNVVSEGETTTGKKDVRLGFGKEFMQNLIINNIYFGTGFDNRWRTKEGDSQGYEASDYPMLGAIAMTGIIGILFFLPVYIILVKSLIIDIKYLRKNNIDYYNFRIFWINYFYDLLSLSYDAICKLVYSCFAFGKTILVYLFSYVFCFKRSIL